MLLALKSIVGGALLAGLCLLPGAASWCDDAPGFAERGLVPADPRPVQTGGARPRGELAAALAAYGNQRPADGLERLVRATLITPGDLRLRLALGSRLLASGDAEGAADQFKRVLAGRPGEAVAWYELAQAAGVRGQFVEAIAASDRALDLMPGWAAAHLRRGLLLVQAGRSAEGLHSLAAIARCSSISPEVNYELGNLFLTRGAPADAIPYFELALAAHPDDSHAANNLGNAHRALKHDALARACYERSAAADRDNPNPRNALGVLHQEAGDLVGALALFHEACHADPHYADAHYNAGALLLREGQIHEAIEELEAAIARAPALAVAQLRLAEAQRAAGHLARANAHFARAVALDPTLAKWHAQFDAPPPRRNR